MPDALSERVMNALKADPRTLDLRALAPHFYNLSERILELFEEEEMVDVLGDVGGSYLWLLSLAGEDSSGINKLLGIQETGGRDC
jgi:hypothetical protein